MSSTDTRGADTLGDLAPTTADEPTLLAWLARMRDEHPVWRDRYGMWHVFRRDDGRVRGHPHHPVGGAG